MSGTDFDVFRDWKWVFVGIMYVWKETSQLSRTMYLEFLAVRKSFFAVKMLGRLHAASAAGRGKIIGEAPRYGT